MRNRDRSADHERDVEGVEKLFACYTDRGALLDVISNAIVTTQHCRTHEAHQLFGLLVERAVFVSLRIEREEPLEAEMTAAQQLFIHRRAITIELIHGVIVYGTDLFVVHWRCNLSSSEMNEQAFTILEYQQLLALIRRNAQTEAGQTRAERLTPAASTEQLRHELAALAECVLLRGRGVNWSFSDFTDPAETIGRLRVEGATLDPLAILQTAKLCEQAMSARAAILAERENAPVLWQLVENLPRDLNSLVARISNKILPTGELDDRASPELAQIRHDISALRSRITRSLEGLMRRSAEAIQDELVTIRNDRFVIPVKADHRGRVQGVAHGYSS